MKFPPYAITSKPGKLYLHIKDFENGKVELKGILSKVTNAYCLSDPNKKLLDVKQEADQISLSIPENLIQDKVTVVVLEMDDQLIRVVDENLQQEKDGSIKLPVSKCEFEIRRISYDYDTQLTHRWGENTKQGLIWTVNVTEPGTFNVISEDNGNSEYIYELFTENDSLVLDANENIGRLTRKSHDGIIKINQSGVQKIKVYPKNPVRRSNFKFKGLELVPAIKDK